MPRREPALARLELDHPVDDDRRAALAEGLDHARNSGVRRDQRVIDLRIDLVANRCPAIDPSVHPTGETQLNRAKPKNGNGINPLRDRPPKDGWC